MPLDFFPEIEEFLELEPEEAAYFVLEYLCRLSKRDKDTKHHVSNVLSSSNKILHEYAGTEFEEFTKQFCLGWAWLKRELLIAPSPSGEDWAVISKRGWQVRKEEDFEGYRRQAFISKASLHPGLVAKVWPAFRRGTYDTAVFEAFKAVEVHVRKSAGLQNKSIGVQLMREALHTENGPLTDKTREPAEREAMGHLFAGAIGLCKNPHSHRDVELDDINEAAELIMFASYLMRTVDRLAESKKDVAGTP